MHIAVKAGSRTAHTRSAPGRWSPSSRCDRPSARCRHAPSCNPQWREAPEASSPSRLACLGTRPVSYAAHPTPCSIYFRSAGHRACRAFIRSYTGRSATDWMRPAAARHEHGPPASRGALLSGSRKEVDGVRQLERLLRPAAVEIALLIAHGEDDHVAALRDLPPLRRLEVR